MAIAQEHSTVRTQSQCAEKRSRHTKGQAKKRTTGPARHGFLDHAFVPVIGQRLAELGNYRQVEREFFSSLSHLAALYGFPVPDVSAVNYPYNIAQAFEAVRQRMKTVRPNLDVIILNGDNHKSCIATVKTFDTGTWLYYIPVKPLYLLLREGKKPQASLLLSAFSYLNKVVQIPYFTEGYLSDTYDAIYAWCTDDPEEDYYQHMIEDFKVMSYSGIRLLKSIRHPYQLQQFANRVQNFKAMTDNDEELLTICTKLLGLYRQYPNRSLFDNAGIRTADASEEEQIELYQYVSFFWDSEGAIYEQVMETVNVHFQEASGMEEPQTLQLFDTPQKEEHHDLYFEQQLFTCLNELNGYLNDL